LGPRTIFDTFQGHRIYAGRKEPRRSRSRSFTRLSYTTSMCGRISGTWQSMIFSLAEAGMNPGSPPTLKFPYPELGMEHDWTEVLRTPEAIQREELIELLDARQQKRSLDIFNWSDDIKVDPEEFHDISVQQAEAATIHNRFDADYFAAFSSDIVTARSTGDVKPTAFST
jgi:hypothetical protein